MKKYFMTGTDDELQFGDMISVVATKELENGKMLHKTIECKFHPSLVDMLLEEGVIEEKEGEEEGNTLEFCDEDWVEAFESLEKRMDDMEEMVKSMMKDVQTCIEDISKVIKEAKKPSKKEAKG